MSLYESNEANSYLRFSRRPCGRAAESAGTRGRVKERPQPGQSTASRASFEAGRAEGKERRNPLRGGMCGALGGSGWRFGEYAAELRLAGAILRKPGARPRYRHSRKSSQFLFCHSSAFSVSRRNSLLVVFLCTRQMCRMLAKRWICKPCVSHVLQISTKRSHASRRHTVPSRNTPALR